jgi:aerobic-type carbon monoxide dehydrogenase small subunit (CoxS/CutS family)
MKINLIINGDNREFEIEPGKILLDLLREHGYKSVKDGCREGECGACNVLINGRPTNSCMILAAQVDGAEIMTVEALGNPDKPHPIQEAFVEAGAVQCGFCTPGKILSTYKLLQKNSDPNEAEIKQALSGNLCRCTGYVKQIDAVKKAAKKLKELK